MADPDERRARRSDRALSAAIGTFRPVDVESTHLTVPLRVLPRRRWALRLASATVMAAILVVLGSAPPAAAAGLKWSAEIVYTVDPDAGRIRQTTTFGITNDEPSTTSGNVTRKAV